MCYTNAMEKHAFLILACVTVLTAGAGELTLAARGVPAARQDAVGTRYEW